MISRYFVPVVTLGVDGGAGGDDAGSVGKGGWMT